MLVLSRQRDETIIIGDEIQITVVDVRGDKVRLGIQAPRSIQVHRKEVYDAITMENAEACRISVEDMCSAPVAGKIHGLAQQSKPARQGKGKGKGKQPKGQPSRPAKRMNLQATRVERIPERPRLAQ